MKLRIRKRGLPKRFDRLKGAGRAVLIGEVRVSRGARTCLKVLVFPTKRDLRYFWRYGLGKGDLGTGCSGAVQSLAVEHMRFYPGGREEEWTDVDPRYFAVMGLIMRELTMEIIAHESVHAGYAYAARSKIIWPHQKDNPEEGLCYPVGRIASGVNKLLHDSNLYPQRK